MKVKRFFEYLFVIFVILNCNSVYSTMLNKNYYLREILIVLLFFMLIFQIKSSNFNKKKLGKFIIYILIYLGYIMLFYLIDVTEPEKKYDFILLYFITFPMLLMLYLTSKDNTMIKEFLYKFSKVVTILAVISLFFYIFGTLINLIKPSSYIMINWGEVQKIASYFGLHFNAQLIYIFGGNKIVRNTGIFVEAPMYSLNLIIALTINLFVNEKKSVKEKYILLITIFTTLSTTGIILGSILYVINFVKSKGKQSIKILVLPIIGILVFSIGINLLNDKKGTSSYSFRIDDYIACYKAWIKKPLFGNGYKRTEEIVSNMDSNRTKTGLSNSIMVLLAQGGIYLFIFYVIPIFRAYKYARINKKNGVAILDGILLILFITTIFLYKPIAINLLAMGYAVQYREEK